MEKKVKKGKQSSGKQIEKYRELLKSIQEKDKKEEDKGMEMEITWVPGRDNNKKSRGRQTFPLSVVQLFIVSVQLFVVRQCDFSHMSK